MLDLTLLPVVVSGVVDLSEHFLMCGCSTLRFQSSYQRHENEKRRKYEQRVVEIEQSTLSYSHLLEK